MFYKCALCDRHISLTGLREIRLTIDISPGVECRSDRRSTVLCSVRCMFPYSPTLSNWIGRRASGKWEGGEGIEVKKKSQVGSKRRWTPVENFDIA